MSGLFLMAVFCLAMAGYSYQSGTLVMRGNYEKEANPIIYWFGTIAYAVLGLVGLVLGFIKMMERS